MALKFELNLQRMTLIRIAVSIWETPTIKNDVRDFWNEYHSGISSSMRSKKINEPFEAHRCKWIKITNKVLKPLKLVELPAILKDELIHVAIQIGTKIYSWIDYLMKVLPCDGREVMDYAEHICWTHYGTVNEIQIIKSFWLNNSKLNITKVTKIACSYMLEESILERLLKKVEKNEENYQFTDCYVKKHLFIYWRCRQKNDLKNCFKELYKMFPTFTIELLLRQNCSIDQKMLRLCVNEGYFHAVLHFWDKLSEEERDKDLVSLVLKSISSFWEHCYRSAYNDLYIENQYVQICVFLMSQMSPVQLQKLYHKYDLDKFLEINQMPPVQQQEFYPMEKFDVIKFLEMMLCCWPWEEFFLSTLYIMREISEDQPCKSSRLLCFVTSLMRNEHESYSVNFSKYLTLLHEIWLKFTPSLIQIESIGDSGFLSDFFHMKDISNLKKIVNTPSMAAIKMWDLSLRLLFFSRERTELIIAEEYEFLNAFINEFFVSEEEKKIFKQQEVDVFAHFIKYPCRNHRNDFCECLDDVKKYPSGLFPNPRPSYESIDKLLDWQSDSLEERKQFKNKIDAMKVFQFLTEHGLFDVVDEFLNWRFESEKEVLDFKSNLKSHYFPAELIYKVWLREDQEVARKKSDLFLNWLLKSEKEIKEFKNERLFKLRESDVVTAFYIWDNIPELKPDFCDWSLTSQKELADLKDRAINHITIKIYITPERSRPKNFFLRRF